MIENTSQNTPENQSFEDKVFARFNELDERINELKSVSKPDKSEKYKNIAAAVQSGIIALGVLAGAGWTLYIFSALRTSYRADAEIRQIDLSNYRQGVVDIDIKAQQVPALDDTGRSIKIDVQVKNVGNRNLKLEFKEHALAIARVRPNGAPNGGDQRLQMEWYQFSPVPYLYPHELKERQHPPGNMVKPLKEELMRAGQTVSFPCWFRVEAPGLYLIDFEGRLTGEDLKEAQQTFGVVRPINVSGQTFVVVE